MNQSRKDTMILKIRKSSLIVGILCIVSVGINIACLIGSAAGSADPSVPYSQTVMLSNTVGYGIRAVIMLLAAVLFFSMFRSGRPFTPKKIRMVLLIAVFLFLRAVTAGILNAMIVGLEFYKAGLLFVVQGGWMESVLFLFAALIMYYASMLQQESDETL